MPCQHEGAPPDHVVEATVRLIQSLGEQADVLGRQGLSKNEFVSALPAAIERIRGSKSASVADRKNFLSTLLQGLVDQGLAAGLALPGHGEDTVYRLTVTGFGDIAIIQKGCPDGAHSSVAWSAPAWARETYLWWLCDSMRYHPGEHVAKGVNRLRKRFLDTSYPDALDGVVFHNHLCGRPERRCPKRTHPTAAGGIGAPPPCVFVMPDRDEEAKEWNWEGATRRFFPGLLLAGFGIPEEQVPSYVGHVGFRRSGSTVITSRYGPGRVTTYRS